MGTDFVLATQDARRRYAPRRGLRPVARNLHLLVRNGSPNNLSNAVSTGITTRLKHTVDTACAGPRLAFSNWYNNNGTPADGPNPITVKSYIKIADGTFYPVTFRGATSVVIQPGVTVLSDPLGVHFAKDATFYSQTYVSVLSGETYPLGLTTNNTTDTEGVGTGDLTQSAVTASATKGFGPSAIYGTPTKALASPVILTVGDSRVVGYGDALGSADARGWVRRAFDGHLSYLNIGVSGSTAQLAQVLGNLRLRLTIADYVNFDAVVIAYGVNDLIGGKTAVEIEGYLTALYGLFTARGIPVYGATVAPVTTSSDNWQTTANQTLAAWNSERVALNAWIRGTPSPLTGYFELADAVESARDSGKWKVTGVSFGYTADGTHESDGGYIAEAAVVDPSVFGSLLVD